MQLPHGVRKTVEVGPRLTYHAVGVVGRSFGTVGDSCGSPTHQVLDPVAVQGLDQAG